MTLKNLKDLSVSVVCTLNIGVSPVIAPGALALQPKTRITYVTKHGATTFENGLEVTKATNRMLPTSKVIKKVKNCVSLKPGPITSKEQASEATRQTRGAKRQNRAIHQRQTYSP